MSEKAYFFLASKAAAAEPIEETDIFRLDHIDRYEYAYIAQVKRDDVLRLQGEWLKVF